jgi:patatin-like phospholipase/acyl hydrolase
MIDIGKKKLDKSAFYDPQKMFLQKFKIRWQNSKTVKNSSLIDCISVKVCQYYFFTDLACRFVNVYLTLTSQVNPTNCSAPFKKITVDGVSMPLNGFF